MTKKVVAAMSGGVDSSVAAARLVDQGYDVVGIHLALAKVKGHAGGKGCCRGRAKEADTTSRRKPISTSVGWATSGIGPSTGSSVSPT